MDTTTASPDELGTGEHGDEAEERPGSSTVERYVPLVTGLLVALPTLLAHYLPMTDLPLHEGMVGMLRHWGDPAYLPPGMYTLRLGLANQLFYFLALPFAYAFGTAWAVKIVVAASQIAVFTSGARLARYLGRPVWSVLLLAPLALGFTFYWGLVTNLVGFGVFFYTLPVLDRFVEKPTARGLGAVLVALLLQYWAHGSVFMIGIALLGGLAMLKELSLRGTGLRLLPSFVGLAAAVITQTNDEKQFTRGSVVAPTGYFRLDLKLRLLPNVLFGSHEELPLFAMFAVAVLTVAVLVAALRRERSPGAPELASFEGSGLVQRLRWARGFVHEHRFVALGLAFLAGYFVLPFNWHAATLLHERCLGPAWALLVICATPRGGFPRIAKLTAGTVAASVLLVGWPQFVEASRINREIEELFAMMPKGRSLALVSLDRRGAGGGYRVWSAPISAYRELAFNGGRSQVSLVVSPLAPVQLRRELRWNDTEMREFYYSSRGFKPAHDFQMFEYVIGHSREEPVRQLMTQAFAPEADLVASRGEWLLFHSRVHNTPIDAEDRPAPNDLDTVVDRMSYLLAKANGMPATPPPSMVEKR